METNPTVVTVLPTIYVCSWYVMIICLLISGVSLHLYRGNLVEFADLLLRHGVVNAINLDGGGSSTLLQDSVLINYPSDHWSALGISGGDGREGGDHVTVM